MTPMTWPRALCQTLGLVIVLGLAAAGPANAPSGDAGEAIKDAVAIFQKEIAADSKALDGIVDKVELNPIRVKPDPEQTRIVQEAKEQIQWARRQMELAQEAATRAAKSPNPAQAQVELRTAYDLQQQANNWKRRAQAALSPDHTTPSKDSASAGSLPSLFGFESPTFRALVQINATQGSRTVPMQPARGFDSTTRADLQSADPVGYDPASGLLALQDGSRINVTPLVEAARQMMPNVSAKNVFVPAPALTGSGYQVNPQVSKELFAPAATEKLKTIGGVALDATLHLLSYRGVPGFRKLGPSTVVEAPILISLGALYERLRAFEKRWDQLPDELRHPAGIERVHGFVLDPVHQDVFLIGAPARRPQDRLDIDCLILALRATWKDGSVPAVSLDPMPPRWAGPQYSRIYGVPADSLGAKIMLEADYAMKKMTSGLSGASLTGFAALRRREAESVFASTEPGSRQFMPSRFWLVPAPLSPGDLHVSASYRTTLFNSGVLCRTEALSLNDTGTGAPWRGTGEKDPWDVRQADLFNASYDELERSLVPQPPGVFLRLHGLIDLVMAAKLLQEFSVRYPVLEQLAALPMRQLSAEQEVPAFYPGVYVEYPVTRGIYTISGGAVLRVRALRSAMDLYNDATTLHLEEAVDHFQRVSRFCAPMDFSFTLPRPLAEAETLDRIDKLFDHAKESLAKAEFAAARDGFDEVTREEPNHGDAWVGLAAALEGLGDHKSAMSAMIHAIQSEISAYGPLCDKEDLVREAGEQLEKTPEGRLAWKKFSSQVTQLAVASMSMNNRTQAQRFARMVVDGPDDSPMPRLILSLCITDVPEVAARYRQEAIALFEYQSRKDPSIRPEYATALIIEAVERMAALKSKMSSRKPFDQSVSEECETIHSVLAKAAGMSPGRGDIAALEVLTRAIMAFVQIARGELPELGAQLAAARAVVKRYPNLPDAHYALAYMELAEMQVEVRRHTLPGLPRPIVDSILAEMTEALRLDPSYGDVYLMRGLMYAAIGQEEKSRADMKQGERLAHSIELPDGLGLEINRKP